MVNFDKMSRKQGKEAGPNWFIFLFKRYYWAIHKNLFT